MLVVKVESHEEGWWEPGTYKLHECVSEGINFSVLIDILLPDSTRDFIEKDLDSVCNRLPRHALLAISSACHIYINADNGHHGAEVHWVPKMVSPSSFKAREFAVEINNWDEYASDAFMLTHENALLHEMCHIYNGVLGRDCKRIVKMYKKAFKRGKYESVLTIEGDKERAYGIQNHLEFFASVSVAFLGGQNDYYPFTRQDLKEFDSSTFNSLCRIWTNSKRWTRIFGCSSC